MTGGAPDTVLHPAKNEDGGGGGMLGENQCEEEKPE